MFKKYSSFIKQVKDKYTMFWNISHIQTDCHSTPDTADNMENLQTFWLIADVQTDVCNF